MKAVLVYPRLNKLHPDPPLGVMYIAAVLREIADVEIMDMSVLKNLGEVAAALEKAKPDIVGISTETVYAKSALKVAEMAKQLFPECSVHMGGPHPSVLPENTLQDKNIDAVVLGEGERTIVDMVNAIGNGDSLTNVKGIGFKQDGKMIFTEKRDFIENLDELPYPARDLMPMQAYLNEIPHPPMPYPSTSMVVGRGCPYNCSFCQPTCHLMFGKKIRYRSPEKCVDEMELLVEKYRVKGVSIQDDLLTMNKKWAITFCEQIIDRGIDVSWRCNSRINTINDEVLKMMRKAGCINIKFGVESGSQKILDAMNKGITVAQTEKAFELCRLNGIAPLANLMIGYPGENMEDLGMTLELVKRIEPDHIEISITSPVFGTYLYEMAKSKGILLIENDFDKFERSYTGALKLENLTEEDLLEYKRLIQSEFDGMKKSVRFLWNHRNTFLKNKMKRSLSFLKHIKFGALINEV